MSLPRSKIDASYDVFLQVMTQVMTYGVEL